MIALASGSCAIGWPPVPIRPGKTCDGASVDGGDLQELRVPLPLAREGEAQPGEATEAARVPRGKLNCGVERSDGLGGLALGLERRRKVAPCLRIPRSILGLPTRVRDGLHTGAAGATEDVTHADAAGADPEADETEPEDEGEKDEHPLRLLAQAREEHRVLVVRRLWRARARTRGRYSSIRLRALWAALVVSGHALVPRR